MFGVKRSCFLAGLCILAAVAFVLMPGAAYATPPARPDDVIWSRTFGDNGTLTGTSFASTSTGIILCGYGDIPGKDIRGYAIKGDVYGHQFWAKDYGLEGDSYLYKVLHMSDNYCLLVGEWRPRGSERSHGLAIKINDNGDIVFMKSYGDPGCSGSFSDAIREPDGYYLITGTNRSAGGDAGIWLVRIDSDGNVRMDVTSGVNGSCGGEKIVRADNGGYTVAGTIQPEGTPYPRAYVLHVDGNGSKLWEQAYSDPGSAANAIIPYVDGYLFAGHTGGYPQNLMLYRLNLSGAVFRHMEIDGSVDREVAAVAAMPDGGWVLTGDETDAGGKTAGFVMKIDADCQSEWNRSFVGDRSTSLHDMIAFADNYYCMGTDGDRFWLVNVGMDRGPGPSPFFWCLPMLALPALAIGLAARARLRR